MGCKGKVTVSIIHPTTINHLIWSSAWELASAECRNPPIHCCIKQHLWTLVGPSKTPTLSIKSPTHPVPTYPPSSPPSHVLLNTCLVKLIAEFLLGVSVCAIFLHIITILAVCCPDCTGEKGSFVVSYGKQWRETDFYWHEAVRMGTAPLFISNFSPQIGIRRWALQCLKHHFLNLWCGKHDLIPVQCFSSDSPSLQIVFVWHHIEGVIVHHCGWWTAASSGKTSSKNYSSTLQPKCEWLLISGLGDYRCYLLTLIARFLWKC